MINAFSFKYLYFAFVAPLQACDMFPLVVQVRKKILATLLN
jgi:hypothetical protein